MKRFDETALALGLAAVPLLAGCTGGATSSQTLSVAVSVSPNPPHVGAAQVLIHVNDAAGALVTLRAGELFVSWWDPTLGPVKAPPTPMVPMGAMPREHIIIDVSRGPSHYAIPMQFSRAGHWALVFHGLGPNGSYVTGSRDVVVTR